MRTALIILLVIVALLLFYIANELRKGKSVTIVLFPRFVRESSKSIINDTVSMVKPVVETASQDISKGVAYGKAQFKAITG